MQMEDTGSFYDELARKQCTRAHIAHISVGNQMHVVDKLECCLQLGVTERNEPVFIIFNI